MERERVSDGRRILLTIKQQFIFKCDICGTERTQGFEMFFNFTVVKDFLPYNWTGTSNNFIVCEKHRIEFRNLEDSK